MRSTYREYIMGYSKKYRHAVSYPRLLLFLMTMMLFPCRIAAEVLDQSDAGFRVKNNAVVTVTADEAYNVLINDIGKWWDSSHTFSGDAHNLSIENRLGGCFCEQFPGGGGVRHLTIVNMVPGIRLRLSGGLGPLQASGVSGSLTWSFVQEEGKTSIVLEYSVGGYFPGGLQAMAIPVDAMLNEQLQRLQNYIEHGNPVPYSP